jgi:ribosomal protein L7/L12
MSKNTPKLEAEIINLIKKGRRIEAVKFIRENTGLGLKDSKEYMESLIDKIIKNHPPT